MKPPGANDFDVIVIGGAISGAATAFLLKRRDPSLRVLVIEKNEAFKRRVGEATTEVSSFFLTRVLGLTNFLARTQISKNGLRFWFYREGEGKLADCSELGGKYLSTVPAYLIDRSVLDEEMLRRAVGAGAELMRPAQVKSVALHAGGQQEVVLSSDGVEKTLRARWVVDASGLSTRAMPIGARVSTESGEQPRTTLSARAGGPGGFSSKAARSASAQ